MDLNRDPRSGPPQIGQVEHDFEAPLTRMRSHSMRRLPAALPMALAGILVVASVAFGATVVKNVINPDPTAVIIGGEDETPTPTPYETETPTPTATPTTPGAPDDPVGSDPKPVVSDHLNLTVTVKATGEAELAWSAFTGADFAYYKVVRTLDGSPQWPLDEGDTLVAAIDNVNTVALEDVPGTGEFTYRLFAVKSADSGYAILASSDNETVSIGDAVPTATPTKKPAPVVDTANLGALHVRDNGNGTYTFSWSAYAGSKDFNYYKLSGVCYPETPGYAEGKGYWAVIDPGQHSVTVDGKAGTWNFNVEAIYYPSGKTTALARTSVLKVTMVAKELPTAPPQTHMGATAALQANGSVKITWDKYTGDWFSYYGIQKTSNGSTPAPVMGAQPWWYTADKALTYKVDTAVSPGHTYKYVVFAFSEQAFAGSNAIVLPNCNVIYVLAISDVITVTIPAATPTPTPTPEPTPTATPVTP